MVSPREFVFKVVIIGDGAAGKTSLVVQYTEKKFNVNYIMSIGANFAIKLINKPEQNMAIRLQLWDLAGQIHFRFVRPTFYRGAFACIYVFDLTRRESFENIKNWKKEADAQIPNVPCILLGNKVDLVEERVVSKREGQLLADEIGAIYYETSAKDAINVDLSFQDLTEKLIAKHVK